MHSPAADPHLAKARALNDRGQLQATLDECAAAVHVLGAYDDEGAVSYFRWQIESRTQNSIPPPTVVRSPQPGSSVDDGILRRIQSMPGLRH
jgi:hypothetical protein